jgi:hypothetical protein
LLLLLQSGITALLAAAVAAAVAVAPAKKTQRMARFFALVAAVAEGGRRL